MGGNDQQTTTTQNPPWLDQASQDFLGSAGGLYGSGGTPNPNQQNAWNTAAGWGSMAPAALGMAGNGLAGAANYQMDSSWLQPLIGLLGGNGAGGGGGGAIGLGSTGRMYGGGGGGGSRNYTPANATASQVDTSQLGNVTPQTFTDYNINDYLNPYTTSVIDASAADNERSRELQGNADSAAATGAGAFGGSRQGVVQALTNSEYDRNAGTMAANLRNQGFNTASGLIENDIANNLTGQTFNANALNSALGLNANLGTQVSMGNAQGANALTGDRIGADAQRDAARTAAGASIYGSTLNAQNNRLSTMINGALGLGQLGINGGLNAATLRFNGAQGLQNFGAGGLGALGGAGNAQYQMPYDNASWYGNILGGIPHGSQQQVPIYHDRAGGALGGAATGYGATGSPWGAAIGGLLGYVGS
jgi:hypothetical protein